MKYLDEYRDARNAGALAQEIAFVRDVDRIKPKHLASTFYGKLIAVVEAGSGDAVLKSMRKHRLAGSPGLSEQCTSQIQGW